MHDLIEALYREHAPGMTVALALSTNDRQAAEDLVHEVFERAVIKAEYLGKHPNPSGWLYQTGYNLARNRWRLLLRWRHSVARRHPMLSEAAWDELLDLRESLKRLSAPQREVVILHHYLGYDVGEIAAMLSCPEGTVKSRLHRGRLALDQALNPKEAT